TDTVRCRGAFAFRIVQLQRLALLRQITFPPRSASTSAGEEHLASRADLGASAFLCGRFVLFSFQGTFVSLSKSDSYNISLSI
ncbi:hypothetical protein, partial [Saccharococcus caldoxylosilyticus]|uniref:hypothetical protein n=1 Tax=Saccharococcus caldoxylosilyticus TaxID=81408 RepID=UPI001E3C8FEF